MEPLWSPVVATSGKRSQMGRSPKPENKPKPLPWIATGCLRRSMVGRGSTVRVRQRALRKPCVARLFLLITNYSLSRTIGGGAAWRSASLARAGRVRLAQHTLDHCVTRRDLCVRKFLPAEPGETGAQPDVERPRDPATKSLDVDLARRQPIVVDLDPDLLYVTRGKLTELVAVLRGDRDVFDERKQFRTQPFDIQPRNLATGEDAEVDPECQGNGRARFPGNDALRVYARHRSCDF